MRGGEPYSLALATSLQYGQAHHDAILHTTEGRAMSRSMWATVVAIVVLSGPAAAQYEPPAVKPPDAATLKAIEAKTEKLEKTLAVLRKNNVRDPGLAETEIFHKAAVWIVRHKEWYQPTFAEWTL